LTETVFLSKLLEKLEIFRLAEVDGLAVLDQLSGLGG